MNDLIPTKYSHAKGKKKPPEGGDSRESLKVALIFKIRRVWLKL